MVVLGCAPSIAKIDDREWSAIEAGYSVGVNFFGLHPFTPDVLTQERTKHADPALVRERRAARLRMLETLPDQRTTILWKDGSPWSIEDAAPIISATPHLEHTALQWLQVVVHDQPDFSGALAACLRLGSQVDLLRRGYSLHLRSSVVYGAFLGALLGVRRVVLAGVDLDSSTYFWDVDTSLVRPAATTPPSAQEDPRQHSSETGTVSTSASLRSLARALDRLGSTRLEVLRPTSVLAPHLPEAQLGGANTQ